MTGFDLMINTKMLLTFQYTNHRGEKEQRRAIPTHLGYGATAWHKEAQWLLSALDIDKGELRWFSIRDMSEVTAEPSTDEMPFRIDGIAPDHAYFPLSHDMRLMK
jgi:predicted DNA-binding transcriptional regulator YafY